MPLPFALRSSLRAPSPGGLSLGRGPSASCAGAAEPAGRGCRCTSDRRTLKTLLCPVFATNRAQQERSTGSSTRSTPVEQSWRSRGQRAGASQRKRTGVWERLGAAVGSRVLVCHRRGCTLLVATAAGARSWSRLRLRRATRVAIAADSIIRTREFTIDASKLPGRRLRNQSRPFLWTVGRGAFPCFRRFALSNGGPPCVARPPVRVEASTLLAAQAGVAGVEDFPSWRRPSIGR